MNYNLRALLLFALLPAASPLAGSFMACFGRFRAAIKVTRAHVTLRTLEKDPRRLKEVYLREAKLVHSDRKKQLTPLERLYSASRTFPEVRAAYEDLTGYYAFRAQRPSLKARCSHLVARMRYIVPRVIAGLAGATVYLNALYTSLMSHRF